MTLEAAEDHTQAITADLRVSPSPSPPPAVAQRTAASNRTASNRTASNPVVTADTPERAASAYGWSFISLGVRTAVQAISGVLIARAVSPSSFGLGMLIVSFYLVVSSVVLQGANGPLIVRARIGRRVLRNTLLADFSLAVTSAAILLIGGIVFSDGGSTWLALVVVAIGCLLLGIGGPGRAIASRELAFKRTALGEIGGALVGGTIAVVLAIMTSNATVALPLQIVLVDAAGIIATCALLFRPIPDLPASASTQDAGVRYAVQTAGNQLASMGSRNADNWIVSALLGAQALGIYGLAYRLMMLPVQNVAMVLGRVLLPRLRRLGSNIVAIQREIVSVSAAVALIVGPFSGALLPHTRDVVISLFGARWAAAAVPTAALLIAVFPQCCSTLGSQTLASRGFGGEQLRMTLAQLVGALAATAIGSHWGVSGVAVALAISFTLLSVLMIMMVQVRTGISARSFARGGLLYLACAAGALVASWATGLLFSSAHRGIGALVSVTVGMIAGWIAGRFLLPRTSFSGWNFWYSMTPWSRRRKRSQRHPAGAKASA